MPSGFGKFEGIVKYKGVLIFLTICVTTLFIFLGIIFISPRAGTNSQSQNLTVCDLNADMKCNFKDKRIFNYSVGICEGDRGYLYGGDFDGDNCVTTRDRKIFLDAF